MAKAGRLLMAALLCAAVGCASSNAPGPVAGGEEGAELEAVIDTIREAVTEAQTHEVPGFPPLKSVKISLQTTFVRSARGTLRFLVFSLGSTASSESASQLELTMAPPKARREALLPPEELKQALAKAIALAKVGVLKASKGEPPLSTEKITIDSKFTVSVSGSGGAQVTLMPAGLDATGRISREKIHTVSLVFGQ